MKLIKPPRLEAGDRVGLVSPSSGMAGQVPHRVNKAKSALEELGFEVVLAKNAMNTRGYVSGTPAERVSDLHSLFRDKKTKAIISMIGGNHSSQLLDSLDYDMIRKNPKIFMGFSDITVLHYALHAKAGLTTFYGPAALTQLGENPRILPYTLDYLKKALMSDEPIGKVTAAKQWTDEVLNWFTKEDLKRPRKMYRNPGWEWLRSGKASGPIIGGCITSLMHVRSTEYWPSHKGAVFFIETPEGEDFRKGEPVENIDAHLQDLRTAGVFDEISGLIVGRPYQYEPKQRMQLKKVIMERTKGYKFPILYGVDTGHTNPMMTIPLGVKATLDSKRKLFSIDERGTKVL